MIAPREERQTNLDRANSIRPLVCHYANTRNFDDVPADEVPVIVQRILADMLHFYIQHGIGNFDDTLRMARHRFIREVDDEIDDTVDNELSQDIDNDVRRLLNDLTFSDASSI